MMMADNVEETVRQLKEQAAVSVRQRARAEAERDAAASAVEAARTRLQQEFGVTTSQEAKDLQVQLTNELTAAIEDTRQALERINK